MGNEAICFDSATARTIVLTVSGAEVADRIQSVGALLDCLDDMEAVSVHDQSLVTVTVREGLPLWDVTFYLAPNRQNYSSVKLVSWTAAPQKPQPGAHPGETAAEGACRKAEADLRDAIRRLTAPGEALDGQVEIRTAPGV